MFYSKQKKFLNQTKGFHPVVTQTPILFSGHRRYTIWKGATEMMDSPHGSTKYTARTHDLSQRTQL